MVVGPSAESWRARWKRLRLLCLYLFTGVALLSVWAASHHAADLAQQRWQQSAEIAARKPAQFFTYWLEFKRQLLRGLALRYTEQGLPSPGNFEAHVQHLINDNDGAIELPVGLVYAKPGHDPVWLGNHGLDAATVTALSQKLRQTAAPYPPIIGPINREQMVMLVPAGPGLLVLPLNVHQFFTMITRLDVPSEVQLGLALTPPAGPKQTLFTGPNPGAAYQFNAEEEWQGVLWHFHWQVDARFAGGVDRGFAHALGWGGTVFILGLHSAILLLLRINQRLKSEIGFRSQAEQALIQANVALLRNNEALDAKVEERTAKLQEANQSLVQTNAHLNQAMNQLVEAEKLAALGSLVAGVAHELNTPIGINVTVSSTLLDKVQAMQTSMEQGALRRSELTQFLQDMDTGSQLVARNSERAAELISHFKQVAVDQTSMRRRRFELGQLLRETCSTLRPLFKQQQHQLQLQPGPETMMDSFPGAIEQVLHNVVQNALLHGLDADRPGIIAIRYELQAASVQLCISDNGRGMAPEISRRLFEPFFTTQMGQGGSGLGGHIMYNLVHGVLGGEIQVQSEPQQGTTLLLNLPLQAPHARKENEA